MQIDFIFTMLYFSTVGLLSAVVLNIKHVYAKTILCQSTFVIVFLINAWYM